MDPVTIAGLIAAAITIICTVTGTSVQAGSERATNGWNAATRKYIRHLATKISNELRAGRLKLAKLIGAIQAKNTSMLNTYLLNNPAVGATLEEINRQSEYINIKQGEINALERELNEVLSQAERLGYASSAGEARAQQEHEYRRHKNAALALEEQIKQKVEELEKDPSTKIQPTRVTKVYTGDLDSAAAQNLQGGLK